MKNLDQKIEAIYAQKRLKEKVELHLKAVVEKLGYRKNEQSVIEQKLNESEQQIAQMEQLSFVNLFLKALGNKKQQLERERQNYLMNFLKLKTCKERIQAKTFEIKVLQEKLGSLKNVDQELTELLKYKKSFIKYKNKAVAKEIISIESRIRTFQYEQREIEEALESGRTAVKEIKKLLRALRKIESWQVIIDSRAQMYSSYKGKMYSKNLLKEIKVVNVALEQYIDELMDVSQQYELDYDQFIKRIEDFLENFYDGLISDWMFHKEMTITVNIILETIDKIKRIQAMLVHDAKRSKAVEKEEKMILTQLLLDTKLD